MLQTLYVSRSLIVGDTAALDRLMVQAQNNNTIDGITGLLWTDGRRFAQVIEGDDRAVDELIRKLERDSRHTDLQIVQRVAIETPQFGGWSMARPASEDLGEVYEQRMLRQLAALDSDVSNAFHAIIEGSRTALA